jgi:hypothetical protein
MWVLNWWPSGTLLLTSQIIIFLGVFIYLGSKFVTWIPFLEKYQLPVELMGIFLTTTFIYIYAWEAVDKKWEAKEKEVVEKIVYITKEIPVVNTKVVTKLVPKVEYITVNVERVKTEIQIQKEYINADCKINNTAVKLYNQALADPLVVKGEE